jgi:hypothetical protein
MSLEFPCSPLLLLQSRRIEKEKKRRSREFPLRSLFTLWIKRKEREFKRSSLPHKLRRFMRQLVELSAVHSGKHHGGQATLEWPAARPIPDLNRFPSRTHPIPYAVRKTKQRSYQKETLKTDETKSTSATCESKNKRTTWVCLCRILFSIPSSIVKRHLAEGYTYYILVAITSTHTHLLCGEERPVYMSD